MPIVPFFCLPGKVGTNLRKEGAREIEYASKNYGYVYSSNPFLGIYTAPIRHTTTLFHETQHILIKPNASG